MKERNTLLYDFIEVYYSIECDFFAGKCDECKNKKLCDTVDDVITSIGDLYEEEIK